MATTGTDNVQIPISDAQRQRFGRVGVLYGGRSAERDVSLQSGRAVLNGLLAANVDAVGIDLGDEPIRQIVDANLDRVFIALHGPGGEDGQIQALLSYLRLPFTGSGVQGSAFAMDKLRSKQLWRGIGLSTPDFVALSAATDWDKVMRDLGGEVMVKPAHEGSSLGMAKVSTAAELAQAYTRAAALDASVIAEKVINGAEYTVAFLGDAVLPAIRLETDNHFYDYDAKYVSSDTQYHIPCGLPANKERELEQLALDAYHSLDCSGWGRVDVMADADDNFFVLEVNTVPGMTDHSLVPIAAKAKGWSFEELVVRILMNINRAGLNS